MPKIWKILGSERKTVRSGIFPLKLQMFRCPTFRQLELVVLEGILLGSHRNEETVLIERLLDAVQFVAHKIQL